MLEQNALLLYDAIDSVQNIYKDFTKELIPFLIRSDLLPMLKIKTITKSWKQKFIEVLHQIFY